jgi:hypothetical protein
MISQKEYREKWQKIIREKKRADVLNPRTVERMANYAAFRSSDPEKISSAKMNSILQQSYEAEQLRSSVIDFARSKPTFRGLQSNSGLSDKRIQYGASVISLAPQLFAKDWATATDIEKMKMLELASEINSKTLLGLHGVATAGIGLLDGVRRLEEMYSEAQPSRLEVSLKNIPKKLDTSQKNKAPKEHQGVRDMRKRQDDFLKRQQQQMLDAQKKEEDKRVRAASRSKASQEDDNPFGIPSPKKVAEFLVGFSGFIGFFMVFVISVFFWYALHFAFFSCIILGLCFGKKHKKLARFFLPLLGGSFLQTKHRHQAFLLDVLLRRTIDSKNLLPLFFRSFFCSPHLDPLFLLRVRHFLPILFPRQIPREEHQRQLKK